MGRGSHDILKRRIRLKIRINKNKTRTTFIWAVHYGEAARPVGRKYTKSELFFFRFIIGSKIISEGSITRRVKKIIKMPTN